MFHHKSAGEIPLMLTGDLQALLTCNLLMAGDAAAVHLSSISLPKDFVTWDIWKTFLRRTV